LYSKFSTEPGRDRIKALEEAGASLEAALRVARSLSRHGDRLRDTAQVARARLVLVVDDVAETRDLYCATLGFAGFRVAEGRDGFEAIERALALRPDGIVLDFAMPRLDGGEALRRLASDGRTSAIPVVMVTAHLEKVTAEIRDRCAGLLEKPCGPDDLLGAVRRALTPADAC